MNVNKLLEWYIKFNNIITSFGFKESTVDRCIYQKISRGKFIFLVLYVDHNLLTANDSTIMHETKDFFSDNFEKEMEEASYVIGIQIFYHRSKQAY